MENFSKNNLMFKFLEENCPISKIKLNKKDLNFQRVIVIKGVFIRGNDKFYPINKKTSKDLLIMDLMITLNNVFSFNVEEVKIVVSNYLKKLN